MATANDGPQSTSPNPSSSISSSLVSTQKARSSELVITPATEMAITEIKLAAQLALMNPRDESVCLAKILAACDDSEFADAAIFAKPSGGRKQNAQGVWEDEMIEGFSIRFAEEAMRCWKHMRTASMTVADSQPEGDTPGSRTVSYSAWDCEDNASHSEQVTFQKIVERRNSKNRTVLYQRLNSYDDTVYGVTATDEECIMLQARRGSMAVRNLILRLIPAHVKRQAWVRCERTLAKKAEGDLPGARRATIYAFSMINVTLNELEKWLGHAMDTTTGEEIAKLTTMGAAIKAKEATWADFMDGRGGGGDDQGGTPAEGKKAKTQTARTTRPSQAAHAGKAGTMDPPALVLTGEEAPNEGIGALYREIDSLIGILTDGDGSVTAQYEAASRKACGVPETGDLDRAQLVRLRDELKRAVEEKG